MREFALGHVLVNLFNLFAICSMDLRKGWFRINGKLACLPYYF